MKARAILSYIFVGLPGGCLIFMGMLMFNAVLGLLIPASQWTMLVILCLTSLIVGLMARWMRPFHGLGSAIAAGIVAAGIILFLWLSAARNTEPGPVFGPGGMLATIAFSALGGWIFPRLRKPKK